MSDTQAPVQETPVAATMPTTESTTMTTDKPVEKTIDPAEGVTDGSTAAAPSGPNVTNVPKEEKIGKNEVKVEAHPINEGVLNYKAPGLK